jgi:large subunit ribosomal protein L21
MTYAIIKLGGKQFKVSEGDKLVADKLASEVDSTLQINEVLLLNTDGDLKIGTPLVEKATVSLKILKQFKGDKLRVATYKAKSRHRKVLGHRQHLTHFEVTKITSK